jgi:hypothetical protein
VSAEQDSASVGRYGPLGFTAAMVNILVIEFVTMALLPWVYLALLLVPLLLIDVGISAFLLTRQGKLGQIGRGMLIGCIAGPAALLFFIPSLLLAQAVGLV